MNRQNQQTYKQALCKRCQRCFGAKTTGLCHSCADDLAKEQKAQEIRDRVKELDSYFRGVKKDASIQVDRNIFPKANTPETTKMMTIDELYKQMQQNVQTRTLNSTEFGKLVMFGIVYRQINLVKLIAKIKQKQEYSWYVDLAHGLGYKEAFLILQKAGLTHDVFSSEDIESLPSFSFKKVPSLLQLCSRTVADSVSQLEVSEILEFFSQLKPDIVNIVSDGISLSNFSLIAKLFYSGREIISLRKMFTAVRIQEKLLNAIRKNYAPITQVIPPLSFSLFQHEDALAPVGLAGNDLKNALFTPTNGGPTIVSSFANFQKNFQQFTHGLFATLDMTNMHFVGGCVHACLMKVPDKYTESAKSVQKYYNNQFPLSDIDIFGFGDQKDLIRRLFYHLKKVTNNQMLMINTPHYVTFLLNSPYRSVQFVKYEGFKTPEEQLINADVDCSAVAYDGKRVLITHRAALAWIYGHNIIDTSLRRIRGPGGYEKRLLKYVDRGFGVVDMKLKAYRDKLSELVAKVTKDEMKEAEDDIESFVKNNAGLKLLAFVEKFPELRNFLEKERQRRELPGDIRKAHQLLLKQEFIDAYVTYSDYGYVEDAPNVDKWVLESNSYCAEDVLNTVLETAANIESQLFPDSVWYPQ